MKQFQALVLDMDGVMVDSEPLQVEAERLVCQRYGIEIPLSEWKYFKGKKNLAIFTYIIENFAADKTLDPQKLSQEKRLIYLELIHRVLPFPDAVDFVKKERTRWEKLGVATSGSRLVQEQILKRFALLSYFDTIVTGDDVVGGKPDPEPYLLAAHRLGVSPERCVVVEDADNGILSAKAAGCRAYGITTSFPRERLLEVGADVVVDSFQELSRALGFDLAH